jgi:hypothetical protein
MFNPWAPLVVLHVAIVSIGLTVLWTAGRWPRTVVLALGFLVAGGGWAMWSAGDVMAAQGREAGELLLRLGQWGVALGIAGWGLVTVIRKSQGAPAGPVKWTDWAIALGGYWFLCVVIALVEGAVILLGTTPHGEFR